MFAVVARLGAGGAMAGMPIFFFCGRPAREPRPQLVLGRS